MKGRWRGEMEGGDGRGRRGDGGEGIGYQKTYDPHGIQFG